MSIEHLLGKVHNIDCLEFMRGLPDKCVDLVLTDPPYGVKRDKGFGGAVGFGGTGKTIKRREYVDEWDSSIPDKEIFQHMIRISNNQMIFGGNYFAHILPPSTHWIFWDKNMTMPTFGDGELIWTSFKQKSVKKEFFQFNGLISDSADEREHPTQKPSELIKRLLRKYAVTGNGERGTGNGERGTGIIFDPFMGSGTTAVACESMGLPWFGCELEPKYVAIANKRIEAERAQLKLF